LEKIIIDKTDKIVQVNEGGVYWCSFGENVGFEQNGSGDNFSRPILMKQ
jgi:hypothetical protein